MNVLVTGGAGFIGSNLVRLILAERPGGRVVNLDKLTYAGNAENLAELTGHSRHRFAAGTSAPAPGWPRSSRRSGSRR